MNPIDSPNPANADESIAASRLPAWRKAMTFVKDSFIRASMLWPNLRTGIVGYDTFATLRKLEDEGKLGESSAEKLNSPMSRTAGFLGPVETVLIKSAAAGRKLLAIRRGFCQPENEGVFFSLFYYSATSDHAGVHHARELCADVLHCLRALTPGTPDARGTEVTDSAVMDFLLRLHGAAYHHKDVLIRSTEHRLERESENGRLHWSGLGRIRVPKGTAKGIWEEGERPWSDVMQDASECVYFLHLHEPGLFRSGAYALDRLLEGDWVIANNVLGLQRVEHDVFQSGQWFALNTRVPTARLRKAVTRRTKRVRRQLIDGVECYSVDDARRWWPQDMRKQ